MDSTDSQEKPNEDEAAEVARRVVRLAPPFGFEAHKSVVAVLLHSKDCDHGPHHCTLSIDAAEVAHAKLGEAIDAAKRQRSAGHK